MRKTKFQNDYYYHIYNRGVDKRDIFMDEKDYVRFLISMREFNTLRQIDSLRRVNQIKRESAPESAPRALASALGADSASLVEIIAYSLLPNHYHLLLKQIIEGGVSKFMQKLGQGYTAYFNLKNNRTGPLMSSPFKSAAVKTDGYLWRLSCYINGNPEIHKISKAENWVWSSYPDYLRKRNGTLCDKNVILKDFENIQEYKNLVDIIIKESRQRKDDIKKYLLE